MATAPLITAEQLEYIEIEGHRVELIEGRVVVMEPGGTPHGLTSASVTRMVLNFVKEHGLGRVVTNETGVWLGRNPDTVRVPDVAFFAAGRLPDPVPEGYPEVIPDLCVEVIGKESRAGAHEKATEVWLAAGAREAWVVDPWLRTVTVYLSDREPLTLGDGEVVESTALDGFSCSVGDLIE